MSVLCWAGIRGTSGFWVELHSLVSVAQTFPKVSQLSESQPESLDKHRRNRTGNVCTKASTCFLGDGWVEGAHTMFPQRWG